MIKKVIEDSLPPLDTDANLIFARVISVDGNTCSCEDIATGNKLHDVRFSSSADADNETLQLIPAVGALIYVIIAQCSAPVALLPSKIQQIKIKTEISQSGNLEVSGFFSLKNQNETLLSVVTDLLAFIKNIQIVTPQGNGMLLPAQVASIQVLENRFKAILK